MGLWDRSSCAVIIAALGMVMLLGCSSETAAPPRMAFVDPAITPSVTASASNTSAVKFTPNVSRVASATAAAPADLRVMSFNCRVSTLFDLQNTWGLRKGLLVSTIEKFNPDLLGTQECVAAQSDYLRAQLDGYDFVGVGRNDGKRGGEMCGIYFRADKFERLDSGHFWLSETPTVPGSKGWGAIFPRMVTWVKLQPRSGGTPFVWFNTHLDAFSSKARLNGAKLLCNRMASISGGLPTLVTGDFNADAGSDPYRTLVGAGNPAGRMTDTFRAMNATIVKGDGTRHAFRGGRGGPRIDWILASTGFRTLAANIDYAKSGMSYPSDHFPVTAVLRPTAAPVLARIE
jgi:endonuclease/exonuclease/phosphatase family metal-dependent hydrolase